MGSDSFVGAKKRMCELWSQACHANEVSYGDTREAESGQR